MSCKKSLVEKAKKNRKLKKKLGLNCVYCGCTNKLLLTVDHKQPLIRGGADVDENKQVCCFVCNQLKGGLNDVEFKKYLKGLFGLYDVCRVKLVVQAPKLLFFPGYFPGWEPKEKKEG